MLGLLGLLALIVYADADRKVGDARSLPLDDPDTLRAAHAILKHYDDRHQEELHSAGLIRITKATVRSRARARAVRSTARSHHPPPRGPPPLRHLFLQRQIVAGTLTRVELEWAPSSCLKPLAGCAGVGAAVGTLKGKVWSQPWRDFLEVTLDE